MYQLEETFYFYFLLIIPILLMVFIYNKSWQQKTRKKYFSIKSFEFLNPEFSPSKVNLKSIIIFFYNYFFSDWFSES